MSTQNEPVSIGGGVIAVIVAVGPLLTLFGIVLEPEMLVALNTFAIAVVGLVTLLVRQRVSPVAVGAIEPVEGPHGADADDEILEEDQEVSEHDPERDRLGG